MRVSIENNSWDYVQGIIEKEINSAFKLRMKENKMENFKTRKLDARDYHKVHPKMKALDKVLTNYELLKDNCSCTEKDYEEFKIDILNSLFHPPQQEEKT